jgi:PAS domain S-box-containing protein
MSKPENSTSASGLLSILMQSTEATAIYSGKDIIIEYANNTMLTFWGKGPEIIGTKLEEGVPELKGQPFKLMLQEVLRTGRTDEGVIAAETRINGEMITRQYSYCYKRVLAADGQAFILHTAADVTSQLEGARALEYANAQTQALNREQQLNEQLAAVNEELLASNEELTQTREMLASLNAVLEDKVTARTQDLAQSETALKAANEELSAINEELFTTNEELVESERKLQQLLRELAGSEHKIRNMVASAPFPIGVYVGREMRIELVNQSIMDVWGKGNDVVGKTYHEVLPELKGTGIYEQLDRVFMEGRPYHARNQRVDLVVDGRLQPFYFNYSFTALYDDEGHIYGVMNTAAEVTDVVTAKQKIEQSERNLHNMILQAPVAMCIMLGPEHVITVANTLMIELWGKPEQDVINRPVFDALPDARHQGLEEVINQVYTMGETYSANERPVSLVRNGRWDTVYQNFVYEPYRDENGQVQGVIAITIDVTAQVLARRRTEENEKQFRFLLNAMPQQVWTAAPDGTFSYLNEVMIRNFDRTFEDIISQGWEVFIHPDDLPDALSSWQRCLQNKQQYLAEFRLKFSDGEYYWHLARAVPMIENGKVSFWLGTNTNIHQQKVNENMKDEFISIASHELKTPLTTIKGFFQLIKRDVTEQTSLGSFVVKAERQVERLSRLIEDLLDVSKINAGKMVYNKDNFDFSTLLADTVESIQHTSTTHQIELHSACDIQFYGDQLRIEQVLINLLNNAIKYSPGSRKIVVKCEIENNNLVVSVEDLGVGIAEEHLKSLFNRFYRVDNSSARFQGLGLGLFIANEIVKRHGGSFWIESVPGKGSTFSFLLPLNGEQEFADKATDHQTYYEGSFIRIHYQKEKHYLDVEWIGYQNYDSVVKGCGIMMDLMQKNNCYHVLNDNTLVKGNWSEAADWGSSVWFPAMAEAGLKRFAWIYSPSTFSRIAANKSLPSDYEAVRVAFFNNKEAALGWLNR